MRCVPFVSLAALALAPACVAPYRTAVRADAKVLATPAHLQPATAADPFPPAKEGIKIVPDDRGPSCEFLLGELERVTGVHVIVAGDTRALLAKIPVGLMKPLDVPATQVWPVVESILIFNELVLGFVNRDEPRLLSVQSLQGQARTNIRGNATLIKPEELATWSKHPCFLVTTMLDLDATDVRTLSNSMRSMITDANTMQLVPVGNSNTLLLTGFGPSVAALAEMLQRCNESERKRLAEEAKKPPPPTADPAKKTEVK